MQFFNRSLTVLALRSVLISASLSILPSSVAAAHDGAEHAVVGLDRAQELRLESDIKFLSQRLGHDSADLALLGKKAELELKLARHRGEHEDYEASEASFRKLGAQRESAGSLVGLAYSLIGQHEFAEALATARSAASLRPESVEVRALLGDLHFALGNYAEAEMIYELLVSSELNLSSLSRLAEIKEQRGLFSEAQALYDDAIEAGELLQASPSAIAWCKTIAGDLAAQLGDLARAESYYGQALRLDPGAHATLFRMARVERSEGEHELALALLTRLVEDYPRPAYWTELGDVLFEIGRKTEAAKYFDLARTDMEQDLSKSDFGHLRELAEFYLSHDGDAKKAVELAEQDLAEIRRDSGAYETLAWAHFRSGDSHAALAPLRAALRSGPSSVRLLCRAALILESAGEVEQASQLRGRVQTLNPTLRQTHGEDSREAFAAFERMATHGY